MPFQKGNSVGVKFTKNDPRINKNGRPRVLPDLTEALIETLPKEDLLAILMKMVTKAKAGGVKEAELLFDRAFGKVTQGLKVDGPISINVVYENKGTNGDASATSPEADIIP